MKHTARLVVALVFVTIALPGQRTAAMVATTVARARTITGGSSGRLRPEPARRRPGEPTYVGHQRLGTPRISHTRGRVSLHIPAGHLPSVVSPTELMGRDRLRVRRMRQDRGDARPP
jgi:hypothetical protein